MFHRIRKRRGYLAVAVLGSVAALLVLVGLLALPRTAYELDEVMAYEDHEGLFTIGTDLLKRFVVVFDPVGERIGYVEHTR